MNNPYASPAPNAPYGSAPLAGGGEPYRTDDRAEVSDVAVELLRQTKPWVTFLSVVAFIGSALMLLGGVVMMAAGALAPSGSAVPAAAMGAIYIPMAFLYIYPGLKLWGFSSAIGRLLASRSNMDLEAALGQQKSFWKFSGIMTVVVIALYAVMFIGLMVVGVAAGTRH
jgi:Family of unknown function (DUF5362)